MSASEERTRKREGQALICRNFGVNDWREGIPRLIDKPADIIDELKKHPHLWSELSKTVLEENLPSNEELLEFKDYLMIPDNKWGFVVTTFKLQAGSTINYIRKLRLEKGTCQVHTVVADLFQPKVTTCKTQQQVPIAPSSQSSRLVSAMTAQRNP